MATDTNWPPAVETTWEPEPDTVRRVFSVLEEAQRDNAPLSTKMRLIERVLERGMIAP